MAYGPLLAASPSSSSRLQNSSPTPEMNLQHDEKISPMLTVQPNHGNGKPTEHCSVSKGFLSNTGKMHLNP